MASVFPNTFFKHIMNGGIDFDTDTIKVMLLDSSHSNNIDTQEFIDDVSTNEVSGTGYTAGGATLGSVVVSADTTDDEGVVDAADTTWSSSTITAHYAAIYKDTGTAGTSPIALILDLGADKSSSAGDFTIQWDSEGVINAAQAA
jgi:hypothetical protein